MSEAASDAEPFVNRVPTMMGGVGGAEFADFFERACRDPASLVAQVGLLDDARLPVTGGRYRRTRCSKRTFRRIIGYSADRMPGLMSAAAVDWPLLANRSDRRGYERKQALVTT